MGQVAKNTDSFRQIDGFVTGVILNRYSDGSVSLTLQIGEGTEKHFYSEVIRLEADRIEKEEAIKQYITITN